MTSIPNEAEHRQSVIDGLRQLTDFLTEHPDVPVGNNWDLMYHAWGTDEEKRAEVDRVAALLGVTAGSPNNPDHYEAERAFGGVTYGAFAVTDEHMRRYRAASTYAGSVEPEGMAGR
ncbi:MAG: hypothetical protein ACRDP6_24600 [Actinoallomurus sp.]